MIEWNISDPKKYYRQNNNQIKPTIRCKPTATVEALDLAGWPLPYGSYNQPEDNLTDYLEKTIGPDAPEDWTQITRAINRHFLSKDHPVIGPRWNWDIRDALFGLTVGIPFVASTWLTKGGHVVNIVGFTTNDDSRPLKPQEILLDEVQEIIIDDPYGNRTGGTYDTSKSGYCNRYPYAYFVKELWRGTGIQVLKRRGV